MSSARRLSVVVAGDTKEYLDRELGPHVWRLLADNGFVQRMSVGSVGFCRSLVDNSLVAVLPKAYSAFDSRTEINVAARKQEQVFRLIRIFNKISRETKFDQAVISSNRVTSKIEDKTDPVLDALEAALKLRDDYRRNGLYYRKQTRLQEARDHLPINWSQTMNRNAPEINGSSVFFPITFHNSRRRNLHHPLSALHVACLSEIFELTGEKYLLGEVDKKSFEMPKTAKGNPRQHMRSIGADIFDERGCFLNRTILAYLGGGKLKNIKMAERDELLSYTADFENIWEHILRSLFNSDEKDLRLTHGNWYEYGSSAEQLKGIRPEIDGKIESSEADAIIDAKDYRVVNGTRLQGSASDHYKQIIYRLLVKPKDQKNIFNILVFPSLSQGSLFRINGCHNWTDIENSRVFEVSVDYEIAVKRWMGEININVENEVAQLLSNLKTFESELAKD